MNTLPELKLKILKSSNSNDVNFLISLRAFLIDQENCPWLILDTITNLENALLYMHSKELEFFKKINTKNISVNNVKPLDIYRMPKNKRLILVSMIDEILSSLLEDVIYLEDIIRINPFNKDTLYDIISHNKIYISKNIFNIYTKRNNDLYKLLESLNYKNDIYESCFKLTYKIKIASYWCQMWGESKNYNSKNDIVDKLIINTNLQQ